jgi:hypothetical protein
MTDGAQSLAAEVDKYYYSLNLITENVRNGYNDMVLKYCALSLPLIPSLIEKARLDFGEFDISTLPAVELGAKIWSSQGRRDKIDELAALVASHPELAPWQIHIDLAYKRLANPES